MIYCQHLAVNMRCQFLGDKMLPLRSGLQILSGDHATACALMNPLLYSLLQWSIIIYLNYCSICYITSSNYTNMLFILKVIAISCENLCIFFFLCFFLSHSVQGDRNVFFSVFLLQLSHLNLNALLLAPGLFDYPQTGSRAGFHPFHHALTSVRSLPCHILWEEILVPLLHADDSRMPLPSLVFEG